MESARQIAFKALTKITLNKGFSNLVINSALNTASISKRDQSFVTALVYGVVERALTLDFVIKSNSSKQPSDIEPDVLTILRMGVYQIYYMNSVTDSAAVNESVNLAKRVGLYRAAGFVNAVLRSCLRSFDLQTAIQNIEDPIEKLSIKYSCPFWLVEMWHKKFGAERTEVFLKRSIGKPPVFARVNSLYTNADSLIKLLAADGIRAEIDELEDCIVIDSFSDYESGSAFKNGLFHIQDKSSQLCVKFAGIKRGDTVVDVCSAPGGKAFTAAEYLQDDGEIRAFDLHENRVRLIKSGAEKMKLRSIICDCHDAAKYDENIPKADVVICDVVCSGFGIIRRKPEIKYKTQEEVKRLPEIQYNILSNSSNYVKTGGVIVYSTCTVNDPENREIVERFLEDHKDFEVVLPDEEMQYYFDKSSDGCITLFGDDNNCDGFFMCKMKKVR